MSEIKVDTLTGKTSAGDITVTSEGGAATMQLQQGLVKAWSVSGLDDTTIDDSFNTTSQTDHGTGLPSYAFAANFSTVNHSDVSLIGSNSAHIFYNGSYSVKSASTTGNFRCYNTNNQAVDPNFINVISNGDLA